MSRHSGIGLALMAGVMAAMASLCAKLVTSYDDSRRLCQIFWQFSTTFGESSERSNDFIDMNVLVVRLLNVVGIFVFNGLMWTMFTKSLQLCSSSVEATVTNTAANFLTTAFIGRLVFKEQLQILWFIGSIFILAGLFFIHKGSQSTNIEKNKNI